MIFPLPTTTFDPGEIIAPVRRITVRWGHSATSVLAWCGREQAHLTPDLDPPPLLLGPSEGRSGTPKVGLDIQLPRFDAVWAGFRPLLWLLTGPGGGSAGC